MFAHSYPVTLGLSTPDPLNALGERTGLGEYAVQVFFILSGFLLSGSLDGNPDPLRYLANRLSRIVPGFCFAIVVSVLLIAPWMSDQGFWLLASKSAWTSIYWSLNTLGDRTGFVLTAVRDTDMAAFMNGSLWSIPYELVYYLVLLALYMLLRRDSRVAVIVLVLAVVTFAGPRLGLTTIDWDNNAPGLFKLPMAMFDKTLPYFCGGVAFYSIYKRWGINRILIASSAALLILSALLGLHNLMLAFAGPPVIVALGSRRSVLSRLTESIGDVSYGVYLFGWPVTLLVATRTGSVSPVAVFVLSIPLVFGCAYAMHRLVERPVALVFKPWLFKKLPRFGGKPGQSHLEGPAAGPSRLAYGLAYVFCFVMVARFTIYPYPFGLDWFDWQTWQLVIICVVCAVLLQAGSWLSQKTSTTVS